MKNVPPYSFHNLLRGLALVALLFAVTAPQTVQAQSTLPGSGQATFTLKDLGYSSDDEYQGVLVSRSYDVTLPQTWAFSQPATLTILFSHSPSLNSHSSLSVDWNDVRVGSTLLDSTNTDNGSLQIEIPAGSMVAGYNKLTLQFYMGIRDDFCEDFDNPAVWAVVHNTTSFNVSYSTTSPVLNLKTLPGYLIDPSPVQASQVTLVLPSQPTAAELDAAALVSAKLGQFADWRALNLNVLSLNQLSTTPTGNLIFIGTASHLSAQNPSLIPEFSGAGDTLSMKGIDANSGVLWLQASPNDASSIWLSITGSSETGLQKAARGFATTSAFDRLSGQLGVILDTPAISQTATSPNLSYTLANLGYKDIVASGSRQQSSYITFPLQLVFDSQGEATFELNFSHSTALNPDRSSLDILVNNVPVSSVSLNSQNAQNATVDVKVPLRLLKLGSNIITLTSNLQVNKSVSASTLYCTDKYYSDSWLTISPSSSLTFPSGIGQKTASLAGYPNLYLGSASLSNLAFIVPDTIDMTTATVVLQVANRLGRTATGDELLSAVLSASAQSQASTQRPYQIVVGLPAQNSVIMQINDLLPQPFAADKVTPKAVKEMASISPASGSLGYVESLFTKDGQYRLVLTATSSKGLEWVGKALNTPAMYKSITGNLAVLSSSDEIAFFTISSGTSLVTDQPTTSTSTSTEKYNQYPNWVIWLAISVFILSLGALVIIRLKRNHK